jgi:hypothetical protein
MRTVSRSIVTFRCSAEEKTELERLAYARHVTPSELLRSLVAAAADTDAPSFDVDGERALLAAAGD